MREQPVPKNETPATVPVAEQPSANAVTYSQARADAREMGTPFVDSSTPKGHFGLTVQNAGGPQTYWFRGDLGDPGALIVARTQIINGRPTHYVGGSLFGGTLTALPTTRKGPAR